MACKLVLNTRYIILLHTYRFYMKQAHHSLHARTSRPPTVLLIVCLSDISITVRHVSKSLTMSDSDISLPSSVNFDFMHLLLLLWKQKWLQLVHLSDVTMPYRQQKFIYWINTRPASGHLPGRLKTMISSKSLDISCSRMARVIFPFCSRELRNWTIWWMKARHFGTASCQ